MSTQMVFALCVTLLSVVAKNMLNDPAKCCVIAQVQRIQLPGSKSYVLSGALCSLIYIMLRRQLHPGRERLCIIMQSTCKPAFMALKTAPCSNFYVSGCKIALINSKLCLLQNS
jgi:hypothetical protein